MTVRGQSCLMLMAAEAHALGGGGGVRTIHRDAVIRNTGIHMEPLEPCCKIADNCDCLILDLTSRLFLILLSPGPIAADHLANLLDSRGIVCHRPADDDQSRSPRARDQRSSISWTVEDEAMQIKISSDPNPAAYGHGMRRNV